MEVISKRILEDHENTLKNGSMFPTAANATIEILKGYKSDKYLKMDTDTRDYLSVLLNKYGDKYFSLEEDL